MTIVPCLAGVAKVESESVPLFTSKLLEVNASSKGAKRFPRPLHTLSSSSLPTSMSFELTLLNPVQTSHAQSSLEYYPEVNIYLMSTKKKV